MATQRRRPKIDLAALRRLTELADYTIPFSIRVIADLQIADELAGGPRTVEELAAASGAHSPALLRVLRALACMGIFRETAPGTFELTDLAEPLRSDHTLSLRDAYRTMPADVLAWAHLDYSLRTGRPAFEYVHGQNLWDYLSEHPAEAELFDKGMQALTAIELRAVSSAYDWSRFRRLVDVGGGGGGFLAGILRGNPSIQGVLMDLPHVIGRASSILEEAGVAARCEIVARDFFEGVPEGADGYILKRILYGWDDERALTILSSVRAAMGPDSRVIIIEPALDSNTSAAQASAILDMVMLTVEGGRIRSRCELGALLGAARLRESGYYGTPLFPLIEARAS